MTNSSHQPVHPPRVADWLLNLFVSGNQAPTIMGDLLEEFSVLASQRDLGAARRWYWRQSVKTVPYLFNAQLRLAPLRNLAALIAGVLLLWLANMLLLSAEFRIHRYYYPAAWPEPLRLAALACDDMVPVASLIFPSLIIGWIVARVSRRREMALSIMLGVAIAALRLVSVFVYGPVAGLPPVWSLFWLASPIGVVACPLAVFVGGLFARRVEHSLAQPPVG